MNNTTFRHWLVLAGAAIAGTLWLPFLQAIPVISATRMEIQPASSEAKPGSEVIPSSRQPSQQIATAPQPPQLVPAILGGKPVHVLYLTRDGDTVLVRCYPTLQPVLELKARSGQPGEKEGKLTCKPGKS